MSSSMTSSSVAVAVNGRPGGSGGKDSLRAVKWAVENLMPKALHFVLIHVVPTITSIPSPSGHPIPVKELDANVVTMYLNEMKVKFEEIFIPYKKLCKTGEMETLVLEGDNPAAALVRYISDSRITYLVMGSWSSNFITRKINGPGIPSTVLKDAPGTCTIYVVSKNNLITNSVDALSNSGKSSKIWLFSQNKHGSFRIKKLPSGHYSSYVESKDFDMIGASSVTNYSDSQSQALPHGSSHDYSFPVQQGNYQQTTEHGVADTHKNEAERLRTELRNTVAMYNQACENLVHAQAKIHLISSDCLEESKRVNAALKREETFRKIAAEEKEKHLEAVKEIEIARNLLTKEGYEREIAELNYLKESVEKQKIAHALLMSDKRYKRYTREEIKMATDNFSENNLIGEGAYGKVYTCKLDHIPVAIKVLRPGADKKHEFLKEVEVLSKLRHPHTVLLLGACPEDGCLVYEFMEKGNLEDHIFRRSGRPSLPWFMRFRIAFEIACGLAFLHNSKPDPIIHCDLKPGNILLDKNYMSKIGDVGLAKLIPDVVPDNITEYGDSIIAGTLFYMDPEYQRTGTIRPKSDVYAFGIITLQLLAACRPKGLLLRVEDALENGSIYEILDKSVTDWPLPEAEELARIALKCSSLRCRDRPDLVEEVLPVLKKLVDFAELHTEVQTFDIDAPGHYYCPIGQEIMVDPYIAPDGFTYEHKAIKLWLEKHNVSPVTKQRLQQKILHPNHTLRSAIQEWASRVKDQQVPERKDT
ncbi:U-box domain-containing protein 34-like [Apium graveolens]|uniref:U-box domain-containing protein 34-like n=1 Tax=Apium graveolens TaxID=4045 RepID=UPI003D7B348C